ncbi:hypothetical protein AACK17_07220 [Pectobacterium punjabense]|uniref:hypothetical protein n=1 Tax=Pectobacterium punjabense TaxID=2108399 RepID=UPI00311FD661
MFIKLLPDEEKSHLLDLARLLALSDKPLLWDGKTKDELTSRSNIDALSIQQGELENELLSAFELSVTTSSSYRSVLFDEPIEEQLIEALKTFPFINMDSAESRVQAATVVLKTLLEKKKADEPTVPKIILLQLILFTLRDGNITNIEWLLLKEIQRYYQVQDFIFDDLLKRAEVLNSEINKTIALILE